MKLAKVAKDSLVEKKDYTKFFEKAENYINKEIEDSKEEEAEVFPKINLSLIIDKKEGVRNKEVIINGSEDDKFFYFFIL